MDSALEAKLAITEVIYRYCRAVDRMDRPLAETVWRAVDPAGSPRRSARPPGRPA